MSIHQIIRCILILHDHLCCVDHCQFAIRSNAFYAESDGDRRLFASWRHAILDEMRKSGKFSSNSYLNKQNIPPDLIAELNPLRPLASIFDDTANVNENVYLVISGLAPKELNGDYRIDGYNSNIVTLGNLQFEIEIYKERDGSIVCSSRSKYHKRWNYQNDISKAKYRWY